MIFHFSLSLNVTILYNLPRNLPPSPKAIIIDNPTPPPRTSSNPSCNTIKNDPIQNQQKVLRHIHHNGPSSGML